jgi:hypothetical protein
MTSAVVRGADCPPFPRWAGTVLASASAARRTGPQGCDRGPPRRVEPDPDRTITSSPRRPDATLLPLPLAARLPSSVRASGRRRRRRRRRGARCGGAVRCLWRCGAFVWAAAWASPSPPPALSRVLCPVLSRAPFTLASRCPSLSTAGGTLGEPLSWQPRAVPWISTCDSHHRSPRHPAQPSTHTVDDPNAPAALRRPTLAAAPSPKPMLYALVVSHQGPGSPRQTLLHPSHHARPDVRSAPAGLLATPWTIAGAGIVAPKSTVLALAACMGKMAFCIAFAIRPSWSRCPACLLLLLLP